ncbi:hypothetical protein O6H91_01G149400 [Diphasiastrum complanatum]|uniref:Uncharacterized protein n=1 Tax=Diphasiastrum complanatum TaxID=34168 RepID=A0ACC2EX90_DIPCM|nr:hypothetical protein O6H91_01G149400 [Diphasiastrum complanatum]
MEEGIPLEQGMTAMVDVSQEDNRNDTSVSQSVGSDNLLDENTKKSIELGVSEDVGMAEGVSLEQEVAVAVEVCQECNKDDTPVSQGIGSDNLLDESMRKSLGLGVNVDVAMEEGVSLKQEGGVLAGTGAAPRVQKCILNLPWSWNAEVFKTFLGEKDILFVAAKKKKGMCIGFITFAAAEYASLAKELEGLWVNKRKLKVEDVQPRICTWDKPRELSKGIQNESIESQKSMTVEEKASSGVILSLENLVNKCAGDITKTRDVCDAVTPLARIPYEEQLTLKKNAISQILKKLARNTRKCCADDVIIPYWLSSTKDRGKGDTA